MPDYRYRAALLTALERERPRPGSNSNLQSGSVLRQASEELGIRRDEAAEQRLLTEWSELFRTGVLAWGHNLDNPNPPFCHFTGLGERLMEGAQRDPGNPAGYLAHLHASAELSPVALSYLTEGLDCYVGGLYKAAAVMVGAASERLVLDVRERLIERMAQRKEDATDALRDWRIKRVLDGLKSYFDQHKKTFGQELRDAYEAYWPAFTQQIRAARNEAGHPTNMDPLTPDAVHAAFLVFPEVAKVVTGLNAWIAEG